MTARERKQKQALRRFAEAVQALFGLALWKKCKTLEDVLYRVDRPAWLPIVHACVERIGHAPMDIDGSESRKDIRWLYRHLLTACGVPTGTYRRRV